MHHTVSSVCLTSCVVCVIVMYIMHAVYGIVPMKRDLMHISSTCNRNIVTHTLKCMTNLKFRASQLHDRYSNSQCIRRNV